FGVFVFDDRCHLAVAVLLHEVNGLMLYEEIPYFLCQRQGPDKHVIGFQSASFQPIASLAHRLRARTITDNSGLDAFFLFYDWLGDKFPSGLKLLFQSIKNVFIIIFIFGISGVGVVTRSTCEIGSHAVPIPRDGSIRYPVTVLVKVTAELFAGFHPFLKLL